MYILISIITIMNESITIISKWNEMICNFHFLLRFYEEAKGGGGGGVGGGGGEGGCGGGGGGGGGGGEVEVEVE